MLDKTSVSHLNGNRTDALQGSKALGFELGKLWVGDSCREQFMRTSAGSFSIQPECLDSLWPCSEVLRQTGVVEVWESSLLDFVK